MFTGIVEAAGKIESLEQVGGDLRAVISSAEMDFSDVKTGDSICVSGVCLTALNIDDNSFSINDNATALAVLEQKIAALENKKVAKPVDISGVVTRSKINEKSIKLLELQIEEIKQSSNPLGG